MMASRCAFAPAGFQSFGIDIHIPGLPTPPRVSVPRVFGTIGGNLPMPTASIPAASLGDILPHIPSIPTPPAVSTPRVLLTPSGPLLIDLLNIAGALLEDLVPHLPSFPKLPRASAVRCFLD